MSSRLRSSRCLLLSAGIAVFAVASAAGSLAAQSVLERTPNLSGGWIVEPGIIQFNFIHRFSQSGEPQRKVVSSPSFDLAYGLWSGAMLGAKYATHSDVAPGLPNEWQFFTRYSPVTQAGGAPLDVAAEAGYNLVAESFDGEVTLARRLGRVRLIGATRALSNGYDAGEVRYAVGGGASVRLLDGLALAGDVLSLLDRREAERTVWGAAVQLRIPYSPHTLSLQATNANTATLEGASRGTGEVRYGFEFTIPLTVRRYLPRSAPEAPPVDEADDTTVAGAFAAVDTAVVTMADLAYGTTRLEIAPGTMVVWRNDDPVVHTATADDGGWDSGEIAPGESWSRTFDEPGTFAYHCTPHPFMTAEIVVRRGGGDR